MMAPSLPRRRPVDPRHCSSSPDDHKSPDVPKGCFFFSGRGSPCQDGRSHTNRRLVAEQLTSVASDQQYPSNVGTFPLELWRFRSSAVAVGARHHTDGLKVLRRLGAGCYVNVPVRLLQERTRLFTLKCFYTQELMCENVTIDSALITLDSYQRARQRLFVGQRQVGVRPAVNGQPEHGDQERCRGDDSDHRSGGTFPGRFWTCTR